MSPAATRSPPVGKKMDSPRRHKDTKTFRRSFVSSCLRVFVVKILRLRREPSVEITPPRRDAVRAAQPEMVMASC